MRRTFVFVFLAIVVPSVATAQGWLGAASGLFTGLAADQAQRAQDSLASARLKAIQSTADLRWRVFLPRAQYVIRQAIDSAPVFRVAAAEYVDTAAVRLLDLYKLEPEATNAQMLDVVAPVAQQYRDRASRAIEVGRALIARLADSLHVKPADNQAFVNAAGARIYALANERIDASDSELRSAVTQVVDSVGRANARPMP
jgi:hypothetical protein